MSLETIKETRKAVKRFSKTISTFIKSCVGIAGDLNEFIQRFKKLFINPAEKINGDLNTYNERVNLAIRGLEAGITTTTTIPEHPGAKS